MNRTPPLRRRALTLLALTALALSGAAQAQDFPAAGRPITIVVPFAAGSGTDTQARVVGQAIASEFKVPVVIDNKAGANGFLAAQQVARAAPDGYTLLMTTNTTHAANEHLFKKLPYDPVKDFTPITLMGLGAMYLVVRHDSPLKTVADLLALARSSPGKLNFGAGSSSSRVGSEMLKQLAGLKVTHVPYKSNPMAVADLIGGQIDFMFLDAPTAMPHLAAGGKLRPLAVSGNARLSGTPAVPTMDEAGVKGVVVTSWQAFAAPKGLPADIKAKLHAAVVAGLADPAVRSKLQDLGFEIVGNTPEQFTAFQAAEFARWQKVIEVGKITAD